ncbi:hypothetical protein J2W30_003625 [Variovorax boronicumulans]|uniref:hypothetical protein n=1 Tax=Variovorax boronicumulans TaxID=436515 RepID=UPI002783F5B4|nr:hypothetical protein [Variovorax boronicumulans]MDQ0035857.1 hypothetical protein [Variovorax boronicumulans]MDQ0068288.1 hypothetical protein [Variovorax boronicumulans]
MPREDPQAAADRAAAEAASKANADAAARRTNQRKSALATGAGDPSALAYGKTTLGA